MSKVVIKPVTENLQENIRECLRTLNYSPCSEEIVIKPNVLKGLPSGSGHVTNVKIVRELINVLRNDYNTKKVFVAENSYINADTVKAFEVAGYSDLEKEFDNVQLVDLKKAEYKPSEWGFKLPTLLEGRCLIDVPVLKGHPQVGLTCAIKNLKGLMQDDDKRNFHLKGLSEHLALLAKIKPCLIVVDATKCLETHGVPRPRKYDFNLLICGDDAVSVDHACCKLVGIPVDEVRYLQLAIGKSNKIDYKVSGELKPLAEFHPFRECIKIGRIYQHIGFSCSRCWDAAIEAVDPGHVARAKSGKARNVLDIARVAMKCYLRSKPTHLVFGHQDTDKVKKIKGKVLLVGNCAISEFGRENQYPCIRGCPPNPEDIGKAL